MLKRKSLWVGMMISGLLFSVVAGALFFILPGHDVFAQQVNTSIGASLGYTSKGLIDIVVNIVNWALGLLALIAVIFIIYGGFLYLTSRGNEEQVDKAKRVLRDAIIGIIIILLAWAIVTFVIHLIEGNTNSNPGGGPACAPSGACIGCNLRCNADGSTAVDAACSSLCLGGTDFKVKWTYPRDGETNVTLCSIIQAGFNDTVDPATVSASTFIVKVEGTGALVAGTYTVAGDKVKFDPTDDYLANTVYRVELPANGIRSTHNRGITYKTWSFTTGTTMDTTPPKVSAIYPTAGENNVCTATEIFGVFSEPMDTFTINTTSATLQNVPASTAVTLHDPFQFPNASSFIASQENPPLEKNTEYQAKFLADVTNGMKDVCGNPLDGNANGTAEGSPTDDYLWNFTTGINQECVPEITAINPTSGLYSETSVNIQGRYLGITGEIEFFDHVYDWGNCFNANLYATDDCVTSWTPISIDVKTPVGSEGNDAVQVNIGEKTAKSAQTYEVLSPHLKWISPTKGGVGQYVTLKGENFGATTGRVVFRRMADNLNIDGTFPPDPPCTASWSDSEIIILVPPGFNFNDYLKVQIIRSDGKRSNLPDFQFIDAPPGPGLCLVNPSCGRAGEQFTAIGEKFGSYTPATDSVNLDLIPTNIVNWSDTSITTASRSNMDNQEYVARVFTEAGVSNPKSYRIPCGEAPKVLDQNVCNLTGSPPVYPSPNPRPNVTDACLNAKITALFDRTMNPATLNASNILISKCNTGDSYDEGTCSTAVPASGINTLTNGFQYDAGFLDQNTWYRVTIKKEVESTDGARMNDDYQWHFRTKNESGYCHLDAITIDPIEATLFAVGETQNFTALPFAQGCATIRPETFSWQWYSSKLTVATVSGSTTALETASATGKGDTDIVVKSEQHEARAKLHVDFCQANDDCNACAGSQCVNNKCTPSITSFSPADGKAGTWVTLSGCYFGSSKGKVKFFDNQDGVWPNPAICSYNTWSENQIIVEVPSGATDGAIKVIRTDGVEGSSGTNYDVNDTAHPGLCRLSRQEGKSGSGVTLYGKTFNPQSVTQIVKFDDTSTTFGSWQDTQIDNAIVPALVAGDHAISMQNDTGISNPMAFKILAEIGGPCDGDDQAPSCQDIGLCGPDAWCDSSGDCKCHSYEGSSCDSQPATDGCQAGPCGSTTQCDVSGDCKCHSYQGTSCDTETTTPGCQTGSCASGLYCDVNHSCTCQSVTGHSCNSSTLPECVDNGSCPSDTHYCEQTSCTCQPHTGDPCSASTTACVPTGHCGSYQSCTNSCFCAYTLPKVIDCVPSATSGSCVSGATDVCRNTLIRVSFDQPMDATTIVNSSDPYNHPNVTLTGPGGAVVGKVSAQGSSLTFVPDSLLGQSLTYTLTVSGTVLSKFGIGLGSDYSFSFTTTGQEGICKLAGADFIISNAEKGDYQPPDLFTCVRDNCLDDMETANAGNQHTLLGVGKDAAGHLILAEFSNISVVRASGDDNVVSINSATTSPIWDARLKPRSDAKSGIATVKVTVSDAPWHTDVANATTLQKSFEVDVFVCDRPWPSSGSPFQDTAYNFSTFYCMDEGLPDFSQVTKIEGGGTGSPDPDLLREYFFKKPGSSDAIGIRIMKNSNHYSPATWYKEKFHLSSSPSGTTIDGYDAAQEGRTVYVGAANVANVTGHSGFTNIYLMSYDTKEEDCSITKNSSFEDDSGVDYLPLVSWDNATGGDGVPDGWGTLAGSVSRDSALGYQTDNTYSAHITNASGLGGIYQEAPLELSQTYTVAGWVRGKFTGSGQMGILVQCINDTTGEVYEGGDCGFYKKFTDVPLYSQTQSGTTEWAHAEYQVSNSLPGYHLRVSCAGSSDGSYEIWCDQVTVIKGTSCLGSQTQQVYSELVKNWRFNTNGAPDASPETQASLRRDVRRIGNLSDLQLDLKNYKNKNGTYPDLLAGTYLKNMSTTLWPSWQANLATFLAHRLAVDPLHHGGLCGPPYDKDTCWDELTKSFSCPAEAYPYIYKATIDEATGLAPTAQLFGHLELPYMTWGGTPSFSGSYSGDPCADNAHSTCRQCVNVSFNLN